MLMELFEVVAEIENRPSRCEDDMEGDSGRILGPARAGRFQRL